VPRTVRRDPAAQSAWSACAWARFRKSAVTPFVWQLAQNDASGMTRPAAPAFAGSFMIAIDLYSLPGPWQLPQSSGGLREACFVWDQELTRCDLYPSGSNLVSRRRSQSRVYPEPRDASQGYTVRSDHRVIAAPTHSAPRTSRRPP
jgi:hypothetical protein